MHTKNIILGSAAAIAVSLSVAIVVSAMAGTNNYAAALGYKGQNREFYVTNQDNPKINETTSHIPPDEYNPTFIAVHKGDNVTIHFYNVETSADDKHSFTIIDSPYKMNVILGGGQEKDINFIANETGIFTYWCSFHQPSMRGQLEVTPPTYDEVLRQTIEQAGH